MDRGLHPDAAESLHHCGSVTANERTKMTKRKFKHLWMIETRNRDGREAEFWTKIGVAFENRDGSYNLELAAVPVSGRLQMREPNPRPKSESKLEAVAA